uniref:Uncharacterized protein n=1 Tax=Panagrolaimus sp. ES5 TaxID=591445 RepID=A0AC34FEY1_9BILA
MEKRKHVALHVLNEHVKLIFPKEKTFADLTSDIKSYSPSNKDCRQDATNNLNFTLVITKKDHIRGVIMVNKISKEVAVYLYDKCNDVDSNAHYAFKSMEGSGENLQGGDCFRSSDAPFQVYDKDNTKHVMELQVSGTFECQAFMELPTYMQIEDIKLLAKSTIPLNETFDGHDETFWWKNKNDEMLPAGVEFDESGNVRINISKSTKEIPYFFRIGQNQPLPSLQFQFDTKCDGFKFGM